MDILLLKVSKSQEKLECSDLPYSQAQLSLIKIFKNRLYQPAIYHSRAQRLLMGLLKV